MQDENMQDDDPGVVATAELPATARIYVDHPVVLDQPTDSGPDFASINFLAARATEIADRNNEVIMAVYADYPAAMRAVAVLTQGGCAMQRLTLIGSAEAARRCWIGDEGKGVSAGSLDGVWGLFRSGVLVESLSASFAWVIGDIASHAVAQMGHAAPDGMTALGTALFGLGLPQACVRAYEEALQADQVLVMLRGSRRDIGQALTLLIPMRAVRIDLYAVMLPG